MRTLVDLLLSLPAVLWAVSFHEVCHSWASWKLGDPTAKMRGRLSLNPLEHFDLWGTLALLVFRFGWAKPVPIDPRYYKNPRRDIVLVSLAGPAGNFLTALVVGRILRWSAVYLLSGAFGGVPLLEVLQYFVIINLGFGLFNLLPIPPLDGSKVFLPLFPRAWQRWIWQYERYGFFVLIALVYTGATAYILGYPLTLLYRLVISPWW